MLKILSNSAFTVLILITVAVCCVLLLRAYQPTMDDIEWTETSYLVQAGDTLWTLSARYCPAQVDRREWVEEIQALNGMTDSTIHPGQTIIVLATAKER